VSHFGSRADEMSLIGLEMALRSSQQMFGRQISPDKEARISLARKCRAMIRKGESPWVTFGPMIDAGLVTLTKRRNKPPLLKIMKKSRRHFP